MVGDRGGGRGGGGAASKLVKKAARKLMQTACCTFSSTGRASRQQQQQIAHTLQLHTHATVLSNISSVSPNTDQADYGTISKSSSTSKKNLCAICLDPLCYNNSSSSPGQAIFTAQCSHAFHFACISSNVKHGNITCPICRAHWTRLPHNLNNPCSLNCYQNDPILQILDDSIATFRVHRRSFLRSARYDDDDPVEPDHNPHYPRLHLSLLSVSLGSPGLHLCSHQTTGPNSSQLCGCSLQYHLNSSSSSLLESQVAAVHHFGPEVQNPYFSASTARACLSVKLAHPTGTDLVLVASPNGPHLRLMKQALALVVFSLRPIDRLAIVTYSSVAARIFPLRRMTSYGKRTALQVIDRLFYMGQADPFEGLKKGLKILGDRAHKNPHSCILHLSDSPTRSFHSFNMEVAIPIHQFHIGFGFGNSNGLVMHEFEEFLARVLGDTIREIQLKIGEDCRIVRLGELKGGEERRIPLDMGECRHVCVEYSYVDGGIDECIRTGKTILGIGDKRDRNDGIDTTASIGGRTSSVETWDYHDPYMARRWAKHLHGYRF